MNVRDYFGKPFKREAVGIEIEMEGLYVPAFPMNYWKCVKEGSLRGSGIEYVLKNPVKRQKVYFALKELHDKLLEKGAKFYESDRTSIHIHLNISDIPVIKVFNIIFLYYLFERMLINYSGDSRKGNLFCLSNEEAERGLFLLRDACKNKNLNQLETDDIRYAGLNLKAIPEYGSLEFRTMRGTMDMGLICHWIKILTLIYDFGLELEDPINILEIFSNEGPKKLFDFVFKNQYNELKYNNWNRDILNSVRNLQYFIYSRIWNDFKPTIEPLIDI